MDLPTFRAQFPAFGQCPDALVTAKLGTAFLLCDATLWGELRSTAAGYYAAHLLSMEPEGRETRISLPDGSTVDPYISHFDRLAASVGRGGFVV